MIQQQTVRSAGRLFEMAKLISDYPKEYTAPKLADYFRVNIRTIRRDIRLLEDRGIRVEFEHPGGYFIMQNLRNMPDYLTELDKLALEIVPSLLRGTLFDGRINPVVSAYQSALGKVLKGRVENPGALGDGVVEEQYGVVADLADIHDGADDRMVMDLLFAMSNNRVIDIGYQKVGSEEEIRTINPYFLIPWQNSLYIVGFCHLRRDFRTFKVARMKSISCRHEKFERDKGFSLKEFMKSAWGIDQSGPEYNVTLAFDADVAGYAKEDIRLHQWVKVAEETHLPDGRYLIRFPVCINHEFTRFVLQYGASVEVMEPENVRRDMAREVARLHARYAGLPVGESGSSRW